MKKETTEQKAAGTILQKPFTVTAGGRTYHVARPTLATLAAVSALASGIPSPGRLKKEDTVPYILAYAARDIPTLARVAATLILGASRPGWRRLWHGWRLRRLARELANTVSSEEMDILITRALTHQNIGFFLAAIISLGGANELKEKKETAAATASGE